MNIYAEYIPVKQGDDDAILVKVIKACYHPFFEAKLEDLHSNNTKQYTLTRSEQLNRALFGDIVYFSVSKEQVINIDSEYKPEIVGVLNASSIVTYGQTNRGIPYYMFKPLNKNYPSFIVPYDKKKYGKTDLFVVIQRHSWLSSKKYPIGTILEYIGEPGIYENEITAILVRYDLPRKNISNRNLRANNSSSSGSTSSNPADLSNASSPLDKLIDMTDKEVFSIDPIGCEDIDDAMHIESICDHNSNQGCNLGSGNQGSGDYAYEKAYEKGSEKAYEKASEKDYEKVYKIGIHIANPALFLPKDGDHDQLAQHRLSSIYTPVSRIDMLHPDLSISRASLKKGEVRPVNSGIFTVGQTGNKVEIINYEFVSALIKTRRNFSYEEAEDLHKKKKYNLITDLFHITDKLICVYLPTFKSGVQDMHRMVEAWMIFINLYVGKELVRKHNDLAVIRVLSDKMLPRVPNNLGIETSSTKLSQNLTNYLEIRQNATAEYRLYSANNDYHAALKLHQYTHFSSPIRRYLDIIVHRMLFSELYPENPQYNKDELERLLSRINYTNKRIRKAERAFDRIRIVKELQDSAHGGEVEEMIVVDFSCYSLELWSERWQTTIKYKIIPKKLRQRYEIDATGMIRKNDSASHDCILTFRKFDEITVKVYPSVKGSCMDLSIELLKPQLRLT